eukprot:TRINITY_DN6928_c0_g1_i1.p1 TRINITY_DN6928_c0_g1~~TRINITY_DN6928_c0_g1_i1.p1  ORF type:complete len:118 (-),score=0.03 TRINITY_DN6928_c0_g1_i1:86-439(-)
MGFPGQYPTGVKAREGKPKPIVAIIQWQQKARKIGAFALCLSLLKAKDPMMSRARTRLGRPLRGGGMVRLVRSNQQGVVRESKDAGATAPFGCGLVGRHTSSAGQRGVGAMRWHTHT